jgi:hypothetical protein
LYVVLFQHVLKGPSNEFTTLAGVGLGYQANCW